MKKIAAIIFALAGVPAVFAGTPSAENYEVPPAAVRSASAEKTVCAEIAPFARFSRDSVPATKFSREKSVPAWRGETVNFRFGVWGGGNAISKLAYAKNFSLKNSAGAKIVATVSPVRWVIG